jgi:hypothetical protein
MNSARKLVNDLSLKAVKKRNKPVSNLILRRQQNAGTV